MARHDEELSVEDWWEGRPVSKHRADLGGFFGHTWPFFLFASICAILAVIGFFVPAKEGPVVAYIMGGLGTLGAVGFVVAAFWRWAVLIKHVDLYDGGLVWQDGGRQIAAWDDVKEFYRYELLVNGAVSRREVTVKTFDGHQATFSFALSNWKGLADRVQYEITMRKVPEALAEYQSGEKVRFGKLAAISQDGITIDGRTFSWERVRGVRVRNGYITVTTSGGEEHPLAIGETPNFPVLLKLLELSPAGLGLD